MLTPSPHNQPFENFQENYVQAKFKCYPVLKGDPLFFSDYYDVSDMSEGEKYQGIYGLKLCANFVINDSTLKSKVYFYHTSLHPLIL